MSAPPALVFEDLAASKPGPRCPRAEDEDLERALLRRDDPLINLALARYGRTGDVVGALFEKGFGEGSGEDEAAYRRGLRVSGYANDRVGVQLFSRGGLLQAIGAEERAPEIFRTGNLDELVTLLRNPEVGEETLAQLFDGRGAFENLPDERWCELVRYAATNPRIVIDKDDEHGPDWGFWKIHEALYRLMQTAPVSQDWCFTLHEAVVRIAPPYVAIKEPVTATLQRWGDLKITTHDGEARSGFYTSLEMGEEFRCMLAAAYGTQFIDSGYKHAGSPTSATLVERCAYYGGAKLTVRDIRRFAERDGEGFGLAYMFNELGLLSEETRRAFERHADYDADLYRLRLASVARSWPGFQSVIDQMDAGEASVPRDAAIARLADQLQELRRLVLMLAWLGVGALVLTRLFGG